MTAQAIEQQDAARSKPLYAAIWRWHFYAGIVFAPFLILLAVTGGIYLFKPQFESWMYKDYYYVQETDPSKLSPSAQIEVVKKAYPDAVVTKYKPPIEADRSAEVGVIHNKQPATVYVNPYNGKILGEIRDDDRIMGQIRKLHGKLMIGTIGDRLIELAACWGMILLITGIYLWWPRGRKSLLGTLVPRLNKGKRIFWRDLHAVPAFWLSLFVAFLILTGLPWSGLWGEMIKSVATATHTGYPAHLFPWDPKPESTIPTKEVGNVPWAAENLPVPSSAEKASGVTPVQPISVEKVMEIAAARQVHPGYDISFPKGPKGVYTVFVSTGRPQDQATLHIDQYSGNVLADLRFKDYGILAKLISIGVALHQGQYFGLVNQIACLLVCIGLILISVSGIVLWWKRKPTGQLGSPPLPSNFKLLKGVAVIVVVLGLVFPLVGVSLLLVLLLDRLVIHRIPAIRQWMA
ncbi:PepSY-associated TM helix domain-containing protein [Effusibacillus pohliae]|uniref:PepSY-associated TM helix domain-containing protein n=1 Tax=Effusibacillus pohliae TaxID=232270 RepID=UPI00036B7C7F|nr:PepSY domain-containing protein [Effusibacillus pohliae]